MTGLRILQRARGRAGALARGLFPRRPNPEFEAQLRSVLRQAAEAITCRGDGLELIRTKTNGAPGQGGAATTTDDD